MVLRITAIFILLFASCIPLKAQNKSAEQVIIDKKGVMRYKKSKEEIKGFGINYTVPFAHAWRSAKKMGIDPKEAMLHDIYHFTRLGFDLYRVHVWDTEISDSLGNLLKNEHLDAFDFLLATLKEHGFNAIITPIAFWGNGWPEPDDATGSFSMKYGKKDALTNPDAIKAQQNYLFQFMNHVNPYTGLAYKDEPMILAFEVSNEPHHTGEAQEVTTFVKSMVEAIRNSGTTKPVFYNISHAVHFADAYFQGGIQGGTFQWYPTGLGYKRELEGNLLPNVDKYDIPFDSTIRKYKGAKIVYEFDAADVNKSYIYPAMARSFRTAGIQLATHFSYDPTYLAYANTEYNTHYMNLVYTPQKALGLMIASSIFHEIPMYTSFGKYPQDTSFQYVTISYKQNLALYNGPDAYIYTNNTTTVPIKEEEIIKVAGWGNSPLVTYGGSGAYFLDKLTEGIWRLEVLPDPIAIDNPFGRNSPEKTVSLIQWNQHAMQLSLKNLGRNFSIRGINKDNQLDTKTSNGLFMVSPGTYLLMRKDAFFISDITGKWGKVRLNDFYAPAADVKKQWFNHVPLKEASAKTDLKLSFQLIAPQRPVKTELIAYIDQDYRTIPIHYLSTGSYQAVIPADLLKSGLLHYYVIITSPDNQTTTYPGAIKGHPYDWNFTGTKTFQTKIVPAEFPIHLFDATSDAEWLIKEWKPGFSLQPTTTQNESVAEINLQQLFTPDIENLNAKPVYDYSIKHNFTELIKGRKADLLTKSKLKIKAKSLNEKSAKLQVALVLDNGAAYGKIIDLQPDILEYSIDLTELKEVRTVTLPRPYPSFLPYYFDHNNIIPFDITKVESLQFSIGPGIPESELKQPHGIGLVSVSLE